MCFMRKKGRCFKGNGQKEGQKGGKRTKPRQKKGGNGGEPAPPFRGGLRRPERGANKKHGGRCKSAENEEE